MSASSDLDRLGHPGDALADPCPQCGFDGAGMTPGDLETSLATLPRRWRTVLAAEDADGSPLADVAPPGGASARAWADAAASALGGSSIDDAVAALQDRLQQAGSTWPPGLRAELTAAVHAGSHGVRAAQASIDAVLDARR